MTDIDALASAWLAAKAREDEAKAERLAVEAQMVEAAPAKTEGKVSLDAAAHKVSVTYGMTRSVDAAALNATWDSLPEGIRRVFPIKHGLDLREMRHWQNNDPAEYARYIAPVLTAKPSKPAVRVELIEPEPAAKAA